MANRITVAPCINSLDQPRYVVSSSGGQNIVLSLIVAAPSEFQELIEDMSLVLLFKGQFNVVYDWSRVPETLLRGIQAKPCWRLLYDKFSKNGLIEPDGLTSRGVVMERPLEESPKITTSPKSPIAIAVPKAPSAEFDFFGHRELEEVVKPAPKGEKLSRTSSGSADKKHPVLPLLPAEKSPAQKSPTQRARPTPKEFERYVRDVSDHIRVHGGNPPMLASSTSKVLTKAMNYIRDQLNLRYLDEASLEAIVRRLEALGIGAP